MLNGSVASSEDVEEREERRRQAEGTPADLVSARSTLTGEHLAAYVGT